ncbi:hypothetical protein P7C71_g6036, partial [Lecanoromycetidae sp. Uapishka_2]
MSRVKKILSGDGTPGTRAAPAQTQNNDEDIGVRLDYGKTYVKDGKTFMPLKPSSSSSPSSSRPSTSHQISSYLFISQFNRRASYWPFRHPISYLAINVSTISSDRALSSEESDPDVPSIDDALWEAYQLDGYIISILNAYETGQRTLKGFPLAEAEVRGDRIWYDERIYVPDYEELRLRIIRNAHDPPAAGHPGNAKTCEIVYKEAMANPPFINPLAQTHIITSTSKQ